MLPKRIVNEYGHFFFSVEIPYMWNLNDDIEEECEILLVRQKLVGYILM